MQGAAGGLFRELDMDLVADGPPPDVGPFTWARLADRLLVAVENGAVIGFIRLEGLDGAVHIEQVTVAPGYGGRGVGTALMVAAEKHSKDRGCDRMTLTAFRDVAFNGPFYASLGWQALPDEGLSPGLAAIRREEVEAGLDRWPRQAMGKSL